MDRHSGLSYYWVDAFTSSAFAGNPAAVVLFSAEDGRAHDSAFMLSIAHEFNLSETAFLVPLPATPERVLRYGLRWFTPTAEADHSKVPLVWARNLASAHVLFSYVHRAAELVEFETMSGVLTARRHDDHQIELDFPADESVLAAGSVADGTKLKELLVQVLPTMDTVGWARGRLGWIIELPQDVDLAIIPLNAIPLKSLGGYFVFTQAGRSDEDCDIKSRVLDPLEEIQEDPVARLCRLVGPLVTI